MSRIGTCFEALKAERRCGLVTYLTGGDPAPETTVDLLHALVEAGADLLEIGVPFSDPAADGPVIQAACERALARGVRLVDVLAMVAEFRRSDHGTPIVLMGYTNPIAALGQDAFAQQAAQAGVDGVIVVDLPPEEAGPLDEALKAHDIDLILLLAPTTGEERMARIAGMARGFLYYVSLKGTTGAGSLDAAAVAGRLDTIRRHTALPLAVGFGIRDGAGVAALAPAADAVVVGSALIERVVAAGADATAQRAAAGALVRELRQAIATAARETATA